MERGHGEELTGAPWLVGAPVARPSGVPPVAISPRWSGTDGVPGDPEAVPLALGGQGLAALPAFRGLRRKKFASISQGARARFTGRQTAVRCRRDTACVLARELSDTGTSAVTVARDYEGVGNSGCFSR